MSSSSLFLGQVLRGRLASYTVSKKIMDVVWFAKTTTSNELVVVKSVKGHPRVENERDVLQRFQSRSPLIRPMIDEIQDPAEPTTIVLKHLNADLLEASIQKPLNRKEIKYVASRVLEALSVLHEDDYVHTDVKPSNIFVNHKEDQSEIRFSDVQLGDFGGSYSQDSKWAKSGTPIGAPVFSSPEVLLETPWNTAADIWSFGAMLITLIYGGDFCIFCPKKARYGDEDFNVEVMLQQFRYFGPYPRKILEIVNDDTATAIMGIMHLVPQEKLTPFQRVVEREVVKEDKEFICKIMKMDWRDRPTAKELLQDEWFHKD